MADEYELLEQHKEAFVGDHDFQRDWRVKAKSCYRFESGKQWDETTLSRLEAEGRPHITINKIRPTVNVVAGFQRMNPYEPQFKPRTKTDLEDAKIAYGVTKYVLDDTVFEYEEGRVFLDSLICGRGVFHVGVEWDFETLDADIRIKRISPLDVYPDRESKDPFWRDAEHVHVAKWVTRKSLKEVYPEFKDDIDAIMSRYDSLEEDEVTHQDGLFYDKATKKVRLFETWYKEHYVRKVHIMPDKTAIPDDVIPEELKGQAVGTARIPLWDIRVSSWIGGLLLEDVDSPYKHKMFPYIPVPAYATGEEGKEGPDGLVSDLIDPQLETNKRRSQALHIINSMANRGWKAPKGALDERNKRLLNEKGSTPGILIEYNVTGGHGLEQFGNDGVPMGIIKYEDIAKSDMQEISGINEAFLAQPLASNVSGRALEIRNRQAITSIARIFDNLRIAKLMLMKQLWGKLGKPGLIPQYYTDAKTVRIVSDNGGDDFVTLNQPQTDPFGNVTGLLHDLSKMEFDIVITEAPMSTTQREKQFAQLLEAAGAGVPIPPDLIVDFSDWPFKEDLKARMVQAQQGPPQQGGSPPKLPTGAQMANSQAQNPLGI